MGWPGRKLVMAALVAALAGTASADPDAARLEYRRLGGATGCPGGAVLSEDVNALLNAAILDEGGSRTVTVVLGIDDEEAWAHIELADADGLITGNRDIVIPGGDCAQLFDTLVLALGIALEEPAAAAEPAPVAPAAAAVPLPLQRRASAPAPPRATPVRYAAGLGMQAGVGTAPGLAAGVTVEARAQRRNASLGLEYRRDRDTFEPFGAGSISTRVQVASLIPCTHRGPVVACAIASAGAVRGQGHGLARSRSDLTPFFAYGARLAWRQAVAPGVALRLSADVVGISGRTTVRVSEMDVWSMEQAAISIGIAALAELP